MPASRDADIDNDDLQDGQAVDEDGAQHASLHIRRLLPNRRIDKYLRHRFPDFSRNVIQRLIAEQAVTVNGKPTKSSYQLNPGDRVDLILPPPPTVEIEPEPVPLNILFEDDDILVLNKQANLVVHPARGNRGGTLVNGLVHYSKSLSQVNEAFRPGIVHRLDRDTTGVIIVAKTDTAHWRLAHQFEHRQTRKTYLAIVQGTLELDADVIDLPLGRHPKVREKYTVRQDIGRPAVTTYELVEQFHGYALVRLFPKTGRTHQLRVHLSAIKHPIVADTIYGGKTVTPRQLADNSRTEPVAFPDNTQSSSPFDLDQPVINRQALHAAELHIRHPITAEPCCFTAPLPEDMQRLLDFLRHHRKSEP